MDDTVKNKEYTYTDYINYPEGERIEIIGGCINNISSRPSRTHQKIILELSTLINSYIKSSDTSSELYISPFNVFLINNDEILDDCNDIVQPDISVICDKNKLNDRYCLGSPDLIIEVSSRNEEYNDYIRKLILYQFYYVREYWIISPVKQNILVYKLDDNRHYSAPEIYTFKDKIKVGIYNNLEIDFNTLDL